MLDTLRNSLRLAGAALMNSELVYSFLMGMGWFFLMGWAIALLVACASAFRRERTVRLAGVAPEGGSGRLAVKTSRNN
jgi:hypothetical protein